MNQLKTVNTNWIAIGLVLLYIALYLVPIGIRPLIIPDEPRYAEIPREILSSGDWIVPHLNGLRYFEKPPLGYWANALSLALFGENPFAVRFPGALAVGLTTFAIFLFVKKTLGKQTIALLSAFIHMTFAEIYIVGTISLLDNLFTLNLTIGIMVFYLASEEEQPRLALSYWVISGLLLGLAFLTKGFLAFAIPVIILVPQMLWLGQWRTLLRYGPLVVLSALIMILPWAVLVHLQESDFWHYFFWVEHIQRFSGDNAQHKAPFYYFLMYLPVLAFPWIAFAPASVTGLKLNDEEKHRSPLLFLLVLWFFLPFIFFSIANGKLITYILPCFPPLAMLLAIGLYHYLQRKQTKLFEYGILFDLFILAVLLIAISITQLIDVGYSLYQENEGLSLIITMTFLIVGIAAGRIAYTGTQPVLRMIAAAIMVLPIIFVTNLAVPREIKQSKAPGRFLNIIQNMLNKDTVLVSDGTMVHSVDWYFKRNDAYLINGGELNYGLSYPDAAGRLLNPDTFSTLLTDKLTDQSVSIFCRKSCPEEFLIHLPDDTQEYRQGKFIMYFIASKQHGH